MKSNFPNKRNLAVDKVKQAIKVIHEFQLGELETKAIAAIDRNLKVQILNKYI